MAGVRSLAACQSAAAVADLAGPTVRSPRSAMTIAQGMASACRSLARGRAPSASATLAGAAATAALPSASAVALGTASAQTRPAGASLGGLDQSVVGSAASSTVRGTARATATVTALASVGGRGLTAQCRRLGRGRSSAPALHIASTSARRAARRSRRRWGMPPPTRVSSSAPTRAFLRVLRSRWRGGALRGSPRKEAWTGLTRPEKSGRRRAARLVARHR